MINIYITSFYFKITLSVHIIRFSLAFIAGKKFQSLNTRVWDFIGDLGTVGNRQNKENVFTSPSFFKMAGSCRVPGTGRTRVNDVSKRVMHSSGPGQKRNENGEFRILEKQTLSGPEMSERHISETGFPGEVKFAVLLLTPVSVAAARCFETLTRIDCLTEKLHRKKRQEWRTRLEVTAKGRKKLTEIICTAKDPAMSRKKINKKIVCKFLQVKQH